MRTHGPLCIPLLLVLACCFRASGQDADVFPAPPSSASPASFDGHSVAVFYVLPSDIPYRQDVMDSLVAATLEIQAWYQIATGGVTFDLAFPEVVELYQAKETRQFYLDNQGWWVKMGSEMQLAGLPIWQPGTISVLWVHGGGHFISGGNTSCDFNCGQVLLGVEMFSALNDTSITGEDECPIDRTNDGRPCLPLGAFAHEIGHAFGLPHPNTIPETAPDSIQFHTVMQTFHNYPLFGLDRDKPWGLLTVERSALRRNPFMSQGVDLVQVHDSAFVVNIPNAGSVPSLVVDQDTDRNEVRFMTEAPEATLYYWMFGDGSVSNEPNPTHVYADTGQYVATVRVSSDSSMMNRRRLSVKVTDLHEAPEVVLTPKDTVLIVGEASLVIDLTKVFADPNGDALQFDASSTDTTVASVHVSGNTLSVTPLAVGVATLTLTGTDDYGLSAEVSFEVGVPTGVANEPDRVVQPLAFSLSQNYPNPFSGSTRIEYTLAEAGEVRLAVFDLLGREVLVLEDGRKEPGLHTVELDAGDIAPGMFYYRLVSGAVAVTKTLAAFN